MPALRTGWQRSEFPGSFERPGLFVLLRFEHKRGFCGYHKKKQQEQDGTLQSRDRDVWRQLPEKRGGTGLRMAVLFAVARRRGICKKRQANASPAYGAAEGTAVSGESAPYYR